MIKVNQTKNVLGIALDFEINNILSQSGEIPLKIRSDKRCARRGP